MTNGTYASLLQAATARLSAAGIETARLDAEVLLAAALGVGRTELYCRLPDRVAPSGHDRFASNLERRAAGEPTAYLTGEREFWSLAFTVTPDVLIPRPETELLVETAVGLAREHPAPVLCDLGTGSGCIAVALAHELPRARIVATDVSAAALGIAARNARGHAVTDRLAFVQGDLLTSLNRHFDVIVSNPPYIADREPLPPEVEREPGRALRAGRDGLDVIRRLISDAPARLRSGGWMLIEIGSGQADAVRRLALDVGFVSLSLRTDFAGIPRVVVMRWQ